LDVACGTADFALESYSRLNPLKVVGIDISENMLQVGRIKVAKQGLGEKVELLQGDCLHLKYDDNIFDAVTVAFGIRNFENLESGIMEMLRVLKPGGNMVILELSEPAVVFKPFYRLYTKIFIPIVACFMRVDSKAYQYLPNSIQVFPKGKEMVEIIKKCGFSEVKYRSFTFGVCSYYKAVK
jgi:demethylmenaquinone methyltransferase/2-methoxy-6-polyprenyl-1,4-benzoquinol methylase